MALHLHPEGQKYLVRCLSVTAIPLALASQAVVGAGTWGSQQRAMQTDHGARGIRHAACHPAETHGKIRSEGRGARDNGGLLRVWRGIERGLPGLALLCSHTLAPPTCSATLVPRTVGGYSDVSRPQRTQMTVLGHHHDYGDRASRSVWCRHVRAAPQMEMKSEYVAKA